MIVTGCSAHFLQTDVTVVTLSTSLVTQGTVYVTVTGADQLGSEQTDVMTVTACVSVTTPGLGEVVSG